MANSKDSYNNQDKYFDTSRKYDHLYCVSFIFYFLEVMTNAIFF